MQFSWYFHVCQIFNLNLMLNYNLNSDLFSKALSYTLVLIQFNIELT